MTDPFEKRLDNHEYQILELRDNIKDLVAVVRESTQSMNNLAKEFAVYTAKHDGIQEDMKEMKESIKECTTMINLHSQELAGYRPTIEAVQGIVWKIITAIMLAAGSAATAVIAVNPPTP